MATSDLPVERAVRAEDHWVAHPRGGRLYARQWELRATAGGTPGRVPIVLWHDWLDCIATWRDWPAMLCHATGRPVIAYDRLGYGRSDAAGERPPPTFLADEAAEVLPRLRSALGIGRFVALGHGAGGAMAVEAAGRWASDCEAVVTLGTPAFVEDVTCQAIRAERARFSRPGPREHWVQFHGDKLRWVLDAWSGRWLDPAFASWSLRPALLYVRAPVLAVHGAADAFGSQRHPAFIATYAGGPVQMVITEGGHAPHREEPRGLAARIATLLASRPAG